jgi:hypothetical protein
MTQSLPARAYAALLRPIAGAWLAAFRALFGVAMCVSMLRFLGYGWVERMLVAPTFRFRYFGFEWLTPLSGPLMHGLFWALAACALGIAVGLCFRLCALGFALGLSYVLLLDVTTYLNHYYLAALLAWLLAFSPAGKLGSIDALIRRRVTGERPQASVPAGVLYLFRFQVGVVYTFAGLAKAQADWLVHAQPLRIWLGTRTDLPVLGGLFTLEHVPLVMSWCGFLFDTTITGFLLWRRTRPFAYAAVIGFHLMTSLLFQIGMFPVIMVLAALVFFEPSWPRRLLERVRQVFAEPARVAPAPSSSPTLQAKTPTVRARPVFFMSAAILYGALQLALPLRSLAYGGNVLWHEQGMRFGWRVMLRAKGGSTELEVRNPKTEQRWIVSPREYLSAMQEAEMSSQPDLILQLAHHVRRDFDARGLGPVEVRAHTKVALNGRRAAPLIDPEVDLTRVQDGLASAEWILPAPSEPPPHTKATR